MIVVKTIKEVIKVNEEFILNLVKSIVKRENSAFFSRVQKVNIILGMKFNILKRMASVTS
jgi:predicted oxidoreductase (fatty acid repression mutant protein)